MEIARVICNGKKLGIASGLRFSVLNEGRCIGNIMEVENIVDDSTAITVFSEMMGMSLPKKFRIVDLVKHIETGEIEIV